MNSSPKNSLDLTDIVKVIRDLATWYGPMLPMIFDMAQNWSLTMRSVSCLIASTTISLIHRYSQWDAKAVDFVNQIEADFSHLESENDGVV